MKRSDLTELEVEQEGLKLRICRGPSGQFSATTSAPASYASGASESGGGAQAPAQPGSASLGPSGGGEAQAGEGFAFVRSPMVGTFYRAASPDMPAFVDVGSKITETTPICIIEAMKVMNEIQAEVKGTVAEVLVDNGQPVEYGQPLFKVRKG